MRMSESTLILIVGHFTGDEGMRQEALVSYLHYPHLSEGSDGLWSLDFTTHHYPRMTYRWWGSGGWLSNSHSLIIYRDSRVRKESGEEGNFPQRPLSYPLPGWNKLEGNSSTLLHSVSGGKVQEDVKTPCTSYCPLSATGKDKILLLVQKL